MKRRLVMLLSVALLLALTLTGCKEKEIEAQPPPTTSDFMNSPRPKPTPTPTPTPTPPPTYYNVLTGEASLEEWPGDRIYAVMINNLSKAMPQCGTTGADIIYEVLVESGTTRMMALFTDLTKAGETLGSIRSSRPYYLELALAYDAIYVHAGGSEQAYSDIKTKGVDNIDGVRGAYGGTVFYRDPSRMSAGYEHSMFTTPERIMGHVETAKIRDQRNEGYEDFGLIFTDDGTPAKGESAKNIKVSFGGEKTSNFAYNAEDGLYYMTQHGGLDYVDGNTKEKVGFTNLMILYAETSTIDAQARRTIKLNGEGTGQFVCGGKFTDINWSHGDTGTLFEYSLQNGDPLELGRGTTYICIVPTTSTIVFE